MTKIAKQPKQHHYIPQVYLKSFTSTSGHFWIYDLWEPGKKFCTKPHNALKERDLYAQPVHTAKIFDARFEGLFSEIEDKWPNLRAKIRYKQDLIDTEKSDLIQFICLMRIRVPNTLKAISQLLSDLVAKQLEVANIPVPLGVLAEFRNAMPTIRLQENTEVNASDLLRAGGMKIDIDPHRRLTSLPLVANSLTPIFGRRNLLTFFHNKTDIDFITSDNPVIYTDNKTSSLPYPSSGTDFSFYFPLTPKLAIRYSTTQDSSQAHRNIYSARTITRLNNLTLAFADRYVVSKSELNDASLAPYRNVCPIPDLASSEVSPTGYVTRIGYKWGPPIRTQPEWQYDF